MLSRRLTCPCAVALAALWVSGPLGAQQTPPAAPPAAAPAAAADSVPPHATTAPTWRWSGALPRGGTLSIALVRGTVRVERLRESGSGESGGSGGSALVEVVARRRGTTSDPASVGMRVDTIAGGMKVTAVYPPSVVPGGGARHDCLMPEDDRGDFWHSDVRVELLVRVSDDARLDVRLVDGDIAIAPVAAALRLATNTGSIHIAEPEGAVWASTGSGDVEVALTSPAARRARASIRLEAYDGAARVVGTEGAESAGAPGFRRKIRIAAARNRSDLLRSSDQ
ncbi:MAG TPA: hypothetical protein VF041_20460 [Gemmatimonadaceae bacterium]